jgi:P-type E1-E2 ATPase
MQALAAVANDLGPGSARLLVTGTIRDHDDHKSSSSSHDSHNNGSNDTSNPTAGRIVPADQVLVGSHVLVLVGEKIPCDGQVVEGHSHVDESTLTGESHPQRRIPGDTVLGGGINVGPECVVVQTTALSSASAVARLAQLVKDARREPSPLETLVDQFAAWYVPPVFGIVVLLCTLPWILYGPTVGRVWAKTGLVTLVAACPCPLVISTPVTYVSGLTHAARHGIIVKGGAVLEVRFLLENTSCNSGYLLSQLTTVIRFFSQSVCSLYIRFHLGTGKGTNNCHGQDWHSDAR